MSNITEVIDVILERQGCLEPSDTARDVVAALTEAGYAIVPVEPTKEMIHAWHCARFNSFCPSRATWEAMIKASVCRTGEE